MRNLIFYVQSSRTLPAIESPDAEIYHIENEDGLVSDLMTNLHEDIQSIVFVGTERAKELADKYGFKHVELI
jgi:hypothetical protein